jgi:hypothetical protein
MAGKITGRIEVLANGNPLLNKAGAVANGIGISGQPNFERAEVMGDSGIHGFTNTPIVASCDVTVTDRDDISLSEIAAINGDGTIIFRSAGGGKVYTMEGATCTMNFTLTGGEGETSIRFVGPFWTESTSET